VTLVSTRHGSPQFPLHPYSNWQAFVRHEGVTLVS